MEPGGVHCEVSCRVLRRREDSLSVAKKEKKQRKLTTYLLSCEGVTVRHKFEGELTGLRRRTLGR